MEVELFFTAEHQLINTEGSMELENHHWMLKHVGEKPGLMKVITKKFAYIKTRSCS